MSEVAPGVRHFAALSLCLLVGSIGVVQLLGDGGVIGWLFAAFLLLGARFYLVPRRDELKVLARALAALVALIAVIVAGLFLSWESAEVVVLRHKDAMGRQVEARLWVIDLDGVPIVASGSSNRRVAAIQGNPEVELVRAGRTECRRAIVIPESAATGTEMQGQKQRARRLAEEKYGLRLYATRILAAFFGSPVEEETVAIRLEPCP